MVHVRVFDRVFLATGLPATTECRPAKVSAPTGVDDDVDWAGSSRVAGTPSFVNGRRQYGAYDIETRTAAVKTARLSRSSTCRIPVRSTTSRLTPRFCLLGALSGRSAGRPSCGRLRLGLTIAAGCVTQKDERTTWSTPLAA